MLRKACLRIVGNKRPKDTMKALKKALAKKKYSPVDVVQEVVEPEEGREGRLVVGEKTKQPEKAAALVGLIDQVLNLYQLQAKASFDEVAFKAALDEANTLYDGFVEKHGLVKDNMKWVKADRDHSVLAALENEQGEKGLVLQGPTLQAPVATETHPTIEDAVITQLVNRGKIEIDGLAKTLNIPVDQVKDRLIDGDLAYPDPQNGWAPKAVVVSGNVRLKARQAEARRHFDKHHEAAYKVIKAAIPDDVDFVASPDNAVPMQGWVKTGWIEDFLRDKFSLEFIEIPRRSMGGEPILNYISRAPAVLYPSEHISFDKAINHWLKGIYPVIKKSVMGGNSIVSEDATEEVREFIDNLTEEFSDFIKVNYPKDVNESYNEATNSIVPFDIKSMGFDQVIDRFPGMSAEFEGKPLKLYPHQVNGVMQYLIHGNTLQYVDVGAGKTLMMFAIAMESKRLGLHNKPLMITKNNLVEEFAEKFKDAYPGARVLAVPTGRGDITRNAINKIGSQNWDLVIMGHSTFDQINVSADKQMSYLRSRLDDYHRAAKEELDRNVSDTMTRRSINTGVKNLRERIDKLQKILHEGQQKGLAGVPFESLGVDMMMVDEAHNYKNLDVNSKIQSLSVGGSGKAIGLEQKIGHIQEVNPRDRGLVFATATPISNKLTELYTLMRYFNRAPSFEEWRADFTDIESYMTVNMQGDPQIKQDISKYKNLRDLMNQLADFVFRHRVDPDTKDRPKRNHIDDEIERPPEWPKIKQLMRAKLKEILAAYRIGIVGSTDTRMVLEGQDNPDKLIHQVVRNVANVYLETEREKGVQVLFLDRFNSKQQDTGEEFKFGDELRDQVLRSGVPDKEVKIVTGSMSQARRRKIIEEGKEGKTRVIIASTAIMGEGVNMQQRLKAVHHVDVPWRPSDMEQREGRAWRKGNMFKEIYIFRYIAKGTFIARLWSRLQEKLEFIQQIGNAFDEGVSHETIREESYGQKAADVIDDPMFTKYLNLGDVFKVVKGRRNTWLGKKLTAESSIASLQRDIERLKKRAAVEKAEKEAARDTSGKKFNAQIRGKDFTDRKEFAEALKSEFGRLVAANNANEVIGKLGGLDITYTTKGDLEFANRIYYSTYFSSDKPPMGAVQSMEASIKKVLSEDKAAKTKAELAQAEKELKASEEVAKQGAYPDEAKFQAMEAEYKDLDRAVKERAKAEQQARREAEAYSATPNTMEFTQDLPTREKLTNIVKSIFPAVRGVNFVAALHGSGPALSQSKAAAGNYSHSTEVAGKANRAKMLITIALNQKFDAENTAYHEAYHLARMLMTPEERAVLENYYKNEEEEAVAFADYIQKGKSPDNFVAMVWAKIKRMFRAMGAALRGAGYKRVEDVFDDVAMGIIGRRSNIKYPIGTSTLYSAPKAAEKYMGSINLKTLRGMLGGMTEEQRKIMEDAHRELLAPTRQGHIASNPRMTVDEIYEMTRSFLPNLSGHDPKMTVVAAAGAKTLLGLSLRKAGELAKQIVEADKTGERGSVVDVMPAFMDAVKLYKYWHKKFSIIASSTGRALGLLRLVDTPPAMESTAQKYLDDMRANVMAGKDPEYNIAGQTIKASDIVLSQSEIEKGDAKHKIADKSQVGTQDKAGGTNQLLLDYLDALTSGEKKRMVDMLNNHYADIIALAKELMSANEKGWVEDRPRRPGSVADKLVNLFYNSLLSSPSTTLVNIVSNMTMLSVYRPLIDSISETLPGGKGFKPVMDGYRSFGMMDKAYEALIHGLTTGEIRHIVGDSAVDDPHTIHDSRYSHDVAEVWGFNHALFALTPQRLLTGTDAFFKSLGFWRVLYQQAHHLARTRVPLARREAFIKEFLRDPPIPSIRMAVKHSRELTFTEPPTAISKSLINLRDSAGIFGIMILPFVRVLWNIMRTSGRLVPMFSLLSFGRDVRADKGVEMVALNKLKGRRGVKARNDLIAEQIVGLGLTAFVVYGISSGFLTGLGPDDEDERNVWMQTSQPYSMLIGNDWYSYSRYTEPFALVLSIITTAMEHLMGRWLDPKVILKGEQSAIEDAIELTGDMMAAVAKTLTNKTMLSNIRNFEKARAGEYQAMWRISLTGTIPSGGKWLARLSQDGEYYDPQTLKEYFLVSIPYGHKAVNKRLDIFGDPINRDKTSLKYRLSAYGHSAIGDKKRMIVNEMARLRVGVPPVKSKITVRSPGGLTTETYSLGRDKYLQYQKFVGNRLFTMLDGLVGSSKYATDNDAQKKAAIVVAVSEARQNINMLMKWLTITGKEGTVKMQSGVVPQELLDRARGGLNGP